MASMCGGPELSTGWQHSPSMGRRVYYSCCSSAPGAHQYSRPRGLGAGFRGQGWQDGWSEPPLQKQSSFMACSVPINAQERSRPTQRLATLLPSRHPLPPAAVLPGPWQELPEAWLGRSCCQFRQPLLPLPGVTGLQRGGTRVFEHKATFQTHPRHEPSRVH